MEAYLQLHANKLIHVDINWGNINIDPENNFAITLFDFGLSNTGSPSNLLKIVFWSL